MDRACDAVKLSWVLRKGIALVSTLEVTYFCNDTFYWQRAKSYTAKTPAACTCALCSSNSHGLICRCIFCYVVLLPLQV